MRSPHAGESWIYGYDDLDRLTCANGFDAPPSGTACTASGGVTDLRQTFQYDLVGNMTANSRVGAYAYPAQGPGSIRPHAVASTPLGTYQYDAVGNMTVQGTDTRTYDGENRLVGAIDGGTTTSFVYGPDGARLKKTAAGVTTLYFGDDTEVLPGATPQYTKYLPGDAERVGLGAANTSWLHRDHLQSVRVVTSSTGGVAFRSHYRPYGEQLATTELQPESKGFIGQRHDDETGLTYLHARYYDPMLGRFIQADPMSPALPGVGVNRYAYAFNNPISYNDPSGLAIPLVVAGVVIGLEELGLLAALGLTAAVAVEEVKNPGFISRGIADAVNGDDVPVPGADLPEVNIPGTDPDVIGQDSIPVGGADVIGSDMGESLGGQMIGAEVPMGTGTPDVLGSDLEQGTYVMSESATDPTSGKATRGANLIGGADRYKQQLTDRTLDAARRELRGEVVKVKADGTPYDHVTKVRDAQRGLRNHIDSINGALSNPDLNAETRQGLEHELGQASKMLDKSEKFVP